MTSDGLGEQAVCEEALRDSALIEHLDFGHSRTTFGQWHRIALGAVMMDGDAIADD